MLLVCKYLPAGQQDQKDLAVRRDTVTPFWWGIKTMLQVGVCANEGHGAGMGLPNAACCDYGRNLQRG